MSEIIDYCVVCGAAITSDQAAYDIRSFLDPMPPQGLACSERCARRAEKESKMRSYLAIDMIDKGMGG